MDYTRQANRWADMIIRRKISIRQVAKECGVGKSTVHTYISKYTTGHIRKCLLSRQLKLNYINGVEKGMAIIKAQRELKKKQSQ